jgi:hypothetical protein
MRARVFGVSGMLDAGSPKTDAMSGRLSYAATVARADAMNSTANVSILGIAQP